MALLWSTSSHVVTDCCQVINSASGRCWSSDTYNPCPGVMEGVPSSNEYQGGFGTPLMTKVSWCQSAIAHDM